MFGAALLARLLAGHTFDNAACCSIVLLDKAFRVEFLGHVSHRHGHAAATPERYGALVCQAIDCKAEKGWV